MNSRLIKVLLTIAIVAGGTTFLMYSSRGDVQYYKMVDELMAEPGSWEGKTMKIHGYVKAGTIDERIQDQQMVRSFVLENKGHEIHVAHRGPKPDTFKDLSEVVAQGRVVKRDGAYVLEAEELMAKCPSKYEGAERNRNLGKNDAVF